MDTVEGILEHFGVKGMKWGQRKADSKRSESSDDARSASDARAKVKTGGIHTLSNKELRDLNERMNLEQQFARLRPASKTQAATKFAAEIILQVGKQQITRLASDAVTKQVSKAMSK